MFLENVIKNSLIIKGLNVGFLLPAYIFSFGRDFDPATNFDNLRWAPVPMHGLAGLKRP